MNKISETELNNKLITKFFNSIDERESKTRCWLWQGSKQQKDSYGIIRLGRKGFKEYAHRFSYRMHYGEEIAKGMFVCHTCDVRHCVNPFHLFLGTHLDNMKDKVSKGRGAKGEMMGGAKLSENDIKDICELRELGLAYVEIASIFNIDHTTSYKIVKNKRWKHIEREALN